MANDVIDRRTPNFALACPGPNLLDEDVLRVIEAMHAIDALFKAHGDDIATRALASAIKAMPLGDLVGTTDAQRLTGKVLDTKTAQLASASTVDIGMAEANRITVTGSAQINSFGAAAAGVSRTVTFAGAMKLSASANLILPGGASIDTKAGDVAELESVTPGTWRCTHYTRADGMPLALGLKVVTVTGASQAAESGCDYMLEGATAQGVTAPTPAAGVMFAVTPVNGLFTNWVDFGAATVIGPEASKTGVITLNQGARMVVRYSATAEKWVVLS